MDMLDTIWVRINHIYITQKHDPKIVRKTDYIAVQVTVWDILKTILINDEYGESSFVINEHLSKSDLILDKSLYVWYEVHYNQDESQRVRNMRTKILEDNNITIQDDKLHTNTEIQSEQVIYNDQELQNKWEVKPLLNQKLTHEKYKEYYKWVFDSMGWIEKLATYTANQIRNIQIDGKKITQISTDCRYNSTWNNNNPLSPKWFQKFLHYVYDLSYKKLTQEEYKEYYKWVFDSQFWWVGLIATYSVYQIRNIQIDDKKIAQIASNYWYRSTIEIMDLYNPKWFHNFLCDLYNITSEQLLIKIKEYYKSIFDSQFWWIEKMSVYTQDQINEIQINNRKRV